MSSKRSGYLSVAVAAVMWSLGGVFVKTLTQDAPGYRMDPWAVACLRSAIGGFVLAWALPRLWTAPARTPKRRVAAAAFAYTVVVLTFVLATKGTSAANAVLLQYFYPLLVAVGAVWLFAERFGWRTVAALALGMSGVGIILCFSWQTEQRAGLLCGVVSAVALASLTLLQRSIRLTSPVALSCLYNLAAGVLILPFVLAYGSFGISFRALVVVSAMGTIQLGVPYVLFIRGVQRVPATDAALITLLEPVLNPVWVWLFVREVPHWSTGVGGGLILLALLVRFVGLRLASPRR